MAGREEEEGNIHKALWSLTTKYNEIELVWILNRILTEKKHF